MSDQEIKINLCYYDPENPNSNLDAYEDEDRPQPRNECGCDNCFYGRDKLAMQLIEAKRERDEAMEEIKEWKTLCLWGGTPEHIHGFIRGQQSRIQHLECERDEAMELLASEKITRNHIIKRSVEVEQERDEAMESLKHIEEYGTEEINAAVELRQKLAQALIERDEAREKSERYRREANKFMLHRDESQEALMRIEDLFINCTDIYEDFKNMGMIAKAALEETK